MKIKTNNLRGILNSSILLEDQWDETYLTHSFVWLAKNEPVLGAFLEDGDGFLEDDVDQLWDYLDGSLETSNLYDQGEFVQISVKTPCSQPEIERAQERNINDLKLLFQTHMDKVRSKI